MLVLKNTDTVLQDRVGILSMLHDKTTDCHLKKYLWKDCVNINTIKEKEGHAHNFETSLLPFVAKSGIFSYKVKNSRYVQCHKRCAFPDAALS